METNEIFNSITDAKTKFDIKVFPQFLILTKGKWEILQMVITGNLNEFLKIWE